MAQTTHNACTCDTAQVWFSNNADKPRPGKKNQKRSPSFLFAARAPSRDPPVSFRRKLLPHPHSHRRLFRLRRQNAGLPHPRRRRRLPLRRLRLPDHLHGPRHRVPATGDRSPPSPLLQPRVLNPTLPAPFARPKFCSVLTAFALRLRCLGGSMDRERTRC